MATYTKQLQKIVADYRKAGMAGPAPAKAIAEWAVQEGRWQLPPAAVTQRCAEDISRAMREEYMTDPQGRRVRVKHPVTRTIDGEQYVLWDDIRTAPRTHMQMAFQQRRLGIVGDCRQLKTDVDSYNDSRPENSPIQMIFDFTMDLAELEAARAA